MKNKKSTARLPNKVYLKIRSCEHFDGRREIVDFLMEGHTFPAEDKNLLDTITRGGDYWKEFKDEADGLQTLHRETDDFKRLLAIGADEVTYLTRTYKKSRDIAYLETGNTPFGKRQFPIRELTYLLTSEDPMVKRKKSEGYKFEKFPGSPL